MNTEVLNIENNTACRSHIYFSFLLIFVLYIFLETKSITNETFLPYIF